MMKFKTQFNNDERFYSNVGDPVKERFIGKYNEKGQLVLESVGKEYLYDYIQSFKDSCDLKMIIKRFTNGETDVLSKVQGFYADVSDLPGNYAEMLQVVTNGERTFMELPVDIRAKFNHNFGEFLAEFGSSDFYNKLGVSFDQVDPGVNEKEVVTDES